jgi:hypothetical protein
MLCGYSPPNSMTLLTRGWTMQQLVHQMIDSRAGRKGGSCVKPSRKKVTRMEPTVPDPALTTEVIEGISGNKEVPSGDRLMVVRTATTGARTVSEVLLATRAASLRIIGEDSGPFGAKTKLQGRDRQTPRKTSDSVGGRLARFLGAWQGITVNRTVLQAVKGHYLDLESTPRLVMASKVSRTHMSPDLDSEIQDLMNKDAIEWAPNTPGHFSRVFGVPKKDTGRLRPVFNLKPLNKHVRVRRFRMATLTSVKQMIRPGDWGVKLDIKDAYLHIPIHPSHRKFLRFMWRRRPVQWKVLPFGLNTAPRTFTQVTHPVKAQCTQQGWRVVFYLDDILLLARSRTQAHQQGRALVDLLQKVGFQINWKKSDLEPRQCWEYLGLRWDARDMTVVLPNDKIRAIKDKASVVLEQDAPTHRTLMRFLGTVTFAAIAVPLGRIFTRGLQRMHLSSYRGPRDLLKRVEWSGGARKDLEWWQELTRDLGSAPLVQGEVQVVLTTDASTTGWGAVCNARTAKGQWKTKERALHINHLELLAVRRGLETWAGTLSNTSVLLQVDNLTVVSYLKKGGGTRSWSLSKEACNILLWCHDRNVRLVPQYLPGIANTLADAQSRDQKEEEWFLLPSVVQRIFRKWGTPEVDLFASHRSAQLPAYLTRRENALVTNWSYSRMYAFPPPMLIPQLLQKFSFHQGKLLLVAPFWPEAPWFGEVVQLLFDTPRRLPLLPQLVCNLTTEQYLPRLHKLRLTLFPLCARNCRSRDVAKKWPHSSWPLSDSPLPRHTNRSGANGLPGVLSMDWTQLPPM